MAVPMEKIGSQGFNDIMKDLTDIRDLAEKLRVDTSVSWEEVDIEYVMYMLHLIANKVRKVEGNVKEIQ